MRVGELHSYPDLLQNFPQGFVGFLGLRLDDIELGNDFPDGPVGFGVAGVDVAAGGDVVVVLLELGEVDDAAEFFLFLPSDEGVGDALDAGLGDEVLGVAFFEDLAGVDKEDLTCPSLGLIS